MKALVRSSNTKQSISAIAAAIVCGVLFLPGCSIPDLRPGAAGPILPEGFNGELNTENSSRLSPAEFFNDPTLINLVDQALANNQQLRILAENIRIANNEVLRRRGTYLPIFTLGTTASLNKFSYNTLEGSDNRENTPLNAPSFPKPLPNFLMASDISWQVDIWRQLRNSRDAAALRFLGTRDGWNFVVTRLIAQIAENYYALMALDQQIDTLNRTIALQERSLEVAKSRKEFARDTELGVQRFQAEVRKNQSQKLIINQQIIETENEINFLCGRYPQPVERSSAGFLDFQLQTLNLGVPSELLLNRPDVGAYGGGSEAANALAAPAIAAALFDATGKIARRLPLKADYVQTLFKA